MRFIDRLARRAGLVFAALCILGLCTTVRASAQIGVPQVRVKAGLFLPQNSSLKNAVGNTWFKVGADTSLPLGINLLGSHTRIGIEWAMKGSSTIVPVTLTQIWQPSAVAHSPFYFGGGVGFWTAKIKGEGTSGRFGLRAVAGIDMTERVFIEGEYDIVGKIGSANADGFSVLIGTKF